MGMASLLPFLPFLLLLLLLSSAADGQPSPGYRPSSSIATTRFFDGYATLWGSQHQSISQDQLSATIWLDRSSGSGFKSKRSYRSGYFGASVKLQGGYTAGVNTAFYLSNDQAYPGFHDEVDMELLGNVAGKPYVLQTNVYVRGSGDGGRLVGREMRFHLWFDPTAGFHHYAILWNPDEIVFFVDDVPIREYTNKIEATFPQREMWIYSSIWDASSWATENGKYKVDYNYQPFVSRFTDLKIRDGLLSPSGNGNTRGLSPQQYSAMKWAQNNYMIYDYCRDNTKDHSLTPEC